MVRERESEMIEFGIMSVLWNIGIYILVAQEAVASPFCSIFGFAALIMINKPCFINNHFCLFPSSETSNVFEIH